MIIKIRIPDGTDLLIDLDEIVKFNDAGATVADLRTKVAEKMNVDQGVKNIRLIYQGRMLSPDTAPLSSFNIVNSGIFVHAVVTNKADHLISQRNSTSQDTAVRQVTDIRGLNALMVRSNVGRGSPLDESEVAALRSYFRDDILAFARENPSLVERQNGSENEDWELRAETAWMNAQGPGSEFRLNLQARSFFGNTGEPSLFMNLFADSLRDFRSFPNHNGHSDDGDDDDQESANDYDATDAGVSARSVGIRRNSAISDGGTELGTTKEFIYGLLMGFALGFMMIFCVWDRNVSHRQKLGILTGMMLQMVINTWQQQYIKQHNQSTHNLRQNDNSLAEPDTENEVALNSIGM